MNIARSKPVPPCYPPNSRLLIPSDLLFSAESSVSSETIHRMIGTGEGAAPYQGDLGNPQFDLARRNPRASARRLGASPPRDADRQYCANSK